MRRALGVYLGKIGVFKGGVFLRAECVNIQSKATITMITKMGYIDLNLL